MKIQGNSIKVIEDKYEDTYVVDTDTGELLAVIPNTKSKKKLTDINKYIGVDVKYPDDCMTGDQLLETLSVLDAYVRNKVKVNDTFLVENAVAKNLTLQQQVFLRNLGSAVCGWNFYIGTYDELSSFGVDKKSLKRTLESVEGLFIKTKHINKPYKGCIILEVNPLLAWKGDNQFRESRKLKWYSIENAQGCA
jgi:hypothetical protein